METRSKRKARELVEKVVAGIVYPEDEWFKHATPFFMTIADFLDMKEGDKTEFILFDRNWKDVTSLNKRGKIYTPKEYFKNAYFVKYTHVAGIFGTRIWYADGGHRLSENARYWELEWNTNYHCWYPITDGILRRQMPDYELPFPPKVDRKHWSNFSRDTLVGWRGPMMRRADLEKMPNIVLV